MWIKLALLADAGRSDCIASRQVPCTPSPVAMPATKPGPRDPSARRRATNGYLPAGSGVGRTVTPLPPSLLIRPWFVVSLLALLCVPSHAATVASVFGGRIPCAPRDGVQFCAGTLATRVESFDGVPLDVNVTLPPASATGAFPLVVDLHGWSLGKTATPYTAWAKAGWVVLSYTARGFHDSCGSAAARLPDATLSTPTVCAERGWIHLADVRYEAHDTQHLAGLLADEGLIAPDRIGVTGASYGGGQSMILAALRDRVMLTDGTLVPWKSPGGLAMSIAAAAPLIPWSDLAYSLTPNGRTLDYRDDESLRHTRRRAESVLERGALHHRARDRTSTRRRASILRRTSSRGTPASRRASPTTATRPSPRSSTRSPATTRPTTSTTRSPPAPLFIYNAWTDDLFPVDETLRFWRKTVAKHPDAEIALRFADDFGHSRAALGFSGTAVIDRVTAFFHRHLDRSR